MNSSPEKRNKFIECKLKKPVQEKGILCVGNNLNHYFPFDAANEYAHDLAKDGDARVVKSSVDAIMGRLVEDVVVYLLRKYFDHNKCPLEVNLGANMGTRSDIFKLVRCEKNYQKKFDVDIVIYNKNESSPAKFFLLSVKGSARERIGQYIANLFLMDDRVIKTKYGDRYYLEFAESIRVKYGFVCFDWGKSTDFHRLTKTGQPRQTMKQTEVCLINDDEYVAGGLSVLNNNDNLHGILNFGELAAKIAKFLE